MMSQTLETLYDMLSCCTYRGDKHSDLLIKETDPSATFKKLLVKAAGQQWFAMDPDRGRKKCKCKPLVMSPLLTVSNRYDHHRACDAIIIAEKENNIYAIFVELKSSDKPSGYVGQLKSSRCFFFYILQLAREFHGVDIKKTQLKERFIVFHSPKSKPSLNKKPTVPVAPAQHSSDPDSPIKRVEYNGATIYLSELIA